jgi:hypothetical protein
VPMGSYTVTENVAPAGYLLDPTVRIANVNSSTTLVLDAWVDNLGKIEILKVDQFANPLGGATFKVSPNPYGAGDLLVTDGGLHDSSAISGTILLENVPMGSYTVTENVAPAGYLLDPTVRIANVNSSTTLVLDAWVDNKPPTQITRTIGFWATHVTYTENVWENLVISGWKTIGIKNIDDNFHRLFGAFWAGISKTSNGDQRDNLDAARMRLLQQLVGAILNVGAFGDNSGTGTSLITAGLAAFSGTDIATINYVENQLDHWNGSGDNLALPPGTIVGSANPQQARLIASQNGGIRFWDDLT